MVAQVTELSTEKDLSVKEENVEVDIGLDAYPAGQLVFPPVRRLLEKADVPIQGMREAAADAPNPLYDGMESELDRLLLRYSEFQDSAVYLARVSRLALAVGRHSAAAEFANQASVLNVSNRNLRYRLAEVQLQAGNLAEAQGTLVELADAGHLLSCLRLCELAIRLSDMDTAAQWLRRAAGIDEGDWRVQALAGTVALATGAFEQAVRNFRNSLDERPRSVRLYHHVALAHVLTGHARAAVKALRKAVGLDPFYKRSLMAWSDLSAHLEGGRPELVRALSRYVELHPGDTPAVSRLAVVLREQGDIGRAYRVLMDASSGADDAELHNNLGVVAAETGKLQQAVAQFVKAVVVLNDAGMKEGDALRRVATSNLMRALIEGQSFDYAVRVAREYISAVGLARSLTEEPDYRVAEGLVEGLMRSGKLQEAVELSEEWVLRSDVHPKLEASLLEGLACYFSLEQVEIERALGYARRCYELQAGFEPRDDRRYAAALNNLAYMLIEIGRYDEAAEYLSRLNHFPGVQGSFAYATRGLLAMRRGRLDKCRELYQRAIGLAGEESKGQLRKKLQWELANYWWEKGDLKRAKRHLSRMLKTRSESIWKLRHLDAQGRALSGKGVQ